MPAPTIHSATTSLTKALQFFRMAGAYFDDVKRDASGSDYRKFDMAKQSMRCRDLFNDLFKMLSKEQAEVLKKDLDESATLDSIFTNAILLTIESREKLEEYALELRRLEIEKLNSPT